MTSLEFRMPDVGEGIAEAEIIRWFVEVGDQIRADEPVCAIETDKSLVEIPSPGTGQITARHGEVGEVIKVGSVLVVIGGANADSAPDAARGPAADAPSPVPGTVSVPTPAPPAPSRRPQASPRTRRLAAERGIDLAAVVGTGPHGRILETDLDMPPEPDTVSTGASSEVDTASSGPSATRRPATGGSRVDQVLPLRGLRRSIARSMTEALTIPHVTEFREVEATRLLEVHSALRASLATSEVRLSVFPLLLQAVIRALREHPSMNATFDVAAETVTQRGAVHLGMATATDDGLIVPVIRDADQLGLLDLAAEADRLAGAARARTATPDELTGGTFTVTNFGSFGTWLGNPIIRPPEVGIIGFGRISEKVIPVDGQPAVRPVLPIVVATDHRIHDGSHLAGFVGEVTEALTEPALLLL